MISKVQLAKIRAFSKRIYEKLDYAHGTDHVNGVVKYSELLAKKENADTNICEAAAWLHDIGYIVNSKTHRVQSGKMAAKLLKFIGVDKETSEAIIHCFYCRHSANCHSTEHENEAKTIEAKCVHDADRLQVLGIHGFLRFYWQGVKGKKLHPNKIIKQTERIQNKLSKGLRTKSAKLIAKRLKEDMKPFYKKLAAW